MKNSNKLWILVVTLFCSLIFLFAAILNWTDSTGEYIRVTDGGLDRPPILRAVLETPDVNPNVRILTAITKNMSELEAKYVELGKTLEVYRNAQGGLPSYQ